MSNGGIFIGIVLVILVILPILQPFLKRSRSTLAATQDDLETLQINYERILGQIKDLDEDYSLGKIQQAFYESERSRFAAQGIQILKSIESLTLHQSEPYEDQIEAAIAARRKQQQR